VMASNQSMPARPSFTSSPTTTDIARDDWIRTVAELDFTEQLCPTATRSAEEPATSLPEQRWDVNIVS